MIKYLAGVLSVIAVGVLLIAYGLLAPGAAASRGAFGQPAFQISPDSENRYATPYADPVSYMPLRGDARPQFVEMGRDPRAVRASSNQLLSSQRPLVRRSIDRSHRRDWKKTALVIAGSSATGAGLGAIFGGGKGAAIGAAIGGGASTLLETMQQ